MDDQYDDYQEEGEQDELPEAEPMSEEDVVSTLQDLINYGIENNEDVDEQTKANFKDANTVSYSGGGYLTNNAGFVIRLADGQEFQVTVIRSR